MDRVQESQEGSQEQDLSRCRPLVDILGCLTNRGHMPLGCWSKDSLKSFFYLDGHIFFKDIAVHASFELQSAKKFLCMLFSYNLLIWSNIIIYMSEHLITGVCGVPDRVGVSSVWEATRRQNQRLK